MAKEFAYMASKRDGKMDEEGLTLEEELDYMSI